MIKLALCSLKDSGYFKMLIARGVCCSHIAHQSWTHPGKLSDSMVREWFNSKSGLGRKATQCFINPAAPPLVLRCLGIELCGLAQERSALALNFCYQLG